MSLNDILLTIAAVLPAVVLCVYVYKKDRAEKEPIYLLLVLLALGGISCYPAARIESVAYDLLHRIFEPYGTMSDGVLHLDSTTFRLYNACKYFFGVALVEEGVKFIALCLATRKNKEFNSLFDGMIYAVFVSLGFAAVENVGYVLKYGWANAVVRALYSVPAHMFFGVLMGYYYSFWHMYDKAGKREQVLKSAGLIESNAKMFSGSKYILPCLLIPMSAHGLYDYCCTIESTLASVIFYLLVLSLYMYCFYQISKMSRIDVMDSRFMNRIILKKYPYLDASLLCAVPQDNDSHKNA